MDSLVSGIKSRLWDEYRGVKKCLLAYSGGIDSQAVGSILKELGVDYVDE